MLLDCLRDWYQYGQAHNLMLKGGWLFPGQQPYNPISTRELRGITRTPIVRRQ
jgi:hypothetical protein